MMETYLKGCTIYAVDFDGTLCEHEYPEIGPANWDLIDWLIKRRKTGDKVILWTNRVGKYLDDAVRWCRDRRLEFDAVNENIPEIIEQYKNIYEEQGIAPGPKVTADVFIDDAACSEGLPFNNPGCPMEGCWNRCCSRRENGLDMPPMRKLELSNRTRNALHRAHICTVPVLVMYTEGQLLQLRAIGKLSVKEIKTALEKYGLALVKG